MAKLSDRQRIFVEQYLIDRNPSKAAVRAGYAARMGRKLASKGHVRDAIEAGLGQIAEKMAQEAEEALRNRGITGARVVQELARIAFFDPGDVFDFSGPRVKLRPANEISEDARRVVAGLRLKTAEGDEETFDAEVLDVKFHDKLSALKVLGRRLGVLDPEPPPSMEPPPPAPIGDVMIGEINLTLLTNDQLSELRRSLAILATVAPRADPAVASASGEGRLPPQPG